MKLKTLKNGVKEVTRILKNIESVESQKIILMELNRISKRPIDRDILDGAKVIDMSDKIRKDQKGKLQPYVIVLSSKTKFKVLYEHLKDEFWDYLQGCRGIYCPAIKFIFPFNKTGLCFIYAGDKDPDHAAWHEFRHYAYWIATIYAIGAQKILIDELYAELCDIYLNTQSWSGLRTKYRITFARSGEVGEIRRRDMFKQMQTILKNLEIIHHHKSSQFIDKIIEGSSSLTTLERKTSKILKKIKK